jgi:hypothetical protein
MQRRFRGGAAGSCAANPRSETLTLPVWADCVEKLVIFDPLMLVITLISFGCS